MSVRLLVIGNGRMGRVVGEIAAGRGCSVVAVYGPAEMGKPIAPGIADVAVEFTVPGSAAANVRACLAAKLPVVSGTTGWDAELAVVRVEVEQAKGAFLHAPNFSLGVQLFRRLVEAAARSISTLNPNPYTPSLSETHHTAKLDKPSGTAKMLARVVGDVLHQDLRITSHRIGEATGTHELVLDGPFERITLIHEAHDRRVFADGAISAAKWLVGRTGVFTFEDYVNDQLTQQ